MLRFVVGQMYAGYPTEGTENPFPVGSTCLTGQRDDGSRMGAEQRFTTTVTSDGRRRVLVPVPFDPDSAWGEKPDLGSAAP